MAKPIALKVENVRFRFHFRAPNFFEGLNLEFEKGKIHFVRGPNGAGKSTLFRILQGNFDKHEQVSGAIYLGDQKCQFDGVKQGAAQDPLSNVKMAQQKFDLMLADQLSFTQNLQLANMSLHPSLGLLPPHQSLPDFVTRFRINVYQPVYLLSGGQRQILAILMALQKPAEVLLLDEPTAALDDQNSTMVMEFLSELVASTQLTILIICHDKELVERYAHEGYFQMAIDEKSGLRTIRFQF